MPMDPGEGGGSVTVDLTLVPGGGGPTGDPRLFGFIVSRCCGSFPPRFTSKETLFPHCLISSMASAWVISLVDLPFISIS